ncbi:hypothetical protein QE152_g39055 [Popillia japonica]|uniref:Uncharacterized protein n=1 Tax=Popillia japonica TaxID=7064 RepID=A0AAW1HV22_POPJA
MKVPLLKRRARELGATADTIAVWELLFTSSMLLQIVEWTNHKLGRIGMKYRIATVHLRNVDVTELKAFLGVRYSIEIMKIFRLFATNGSGRDMCSVTSAKRAKHSVLRFERRCSSTHFIYIFNGFIEHCQTVYGIEESTTIDELLESFRGRVHFKMYFLMKPGKI